MSVKENMALVRRYFEQGLNEHDIDITAAMVASDYVRYSGTQIRGVAAFEQMVRSILEPFPDYHATIEHMFGQGDEVATRWTLRMTHTGAEYEGIPPTGNRLNLQAISIFRVAQGKIAEERIVFDTFGFWQQLGVVPPLEELIEQAKSKHE